MSQTPKNAPCPCGSGKKYKRCCENKRFTKKEDQSVRIHFDIFTFLCRFSFRETLDWLQAVFCYPGNELYARRIEFVIAKLFTIPPDQFEEKKISRDDVIELFERLKAYDKIFYMHEDFEGFSQLNLIPIYYNTERYYFFYAGWERPYEDYLYFIDRFLFSQPDVLPEFQHLHKVFVSSLSFQTKLLLQIKELVSEISGVRQNVYVPNELFTSSISALFATCLPDRTIIKQYGLRVGEFANRTTQDLYENSIEQKLLSSKLFILQGDDVVWLYPQNHLAVLVEIGKSIFKSKFERHLLQERLKYTLGIITERAFTRYRTAISLLVGDKEIISSLTHVVMANENTLLLYMVAGYSLDEDLSSPIIDAIRRMEQIVETIEAATVISVKTLIAKKVSIGTAQLQLMPVVIFDPLNLSYKAAIPKTSIKRDDFHLLSMNDYRSIISVLKSGQNVIKFLIEEQKLHSKNQFPVVGEYMDRFAFYVSNGMSFIRSAQSFNVFVFEAHIWHDFIHDRMHKELKDEDVHLEIHRIAKNYYNELEKIEDGVWRLTHTANTCGAFLLFLESSIVWIKLPDYGQLLSEKEFSIAYTLVGVLFKEYLKKGETLYFEVLKSISLNPIRHLILLLPEDRLEQPDWAFLKSHYRKASSGANAISFYLNETNEIKSFFVFDADIFIEHFAHKENVGERLSMEILIDSMLSLGVVNEEVRISEAQQIVNLIIPLAAKRYSASLIEVDNPKLGSYQLPYRMNTSDFGVVNRIISAFLIQQNVLPGTYKDDEAVNICQTLYKALLLELETQISFFDDTFIPFAYRQNELAEGARYRSKIVTGMKSTVKLDYDLTDHFAEEHGGFTALTMTQRFILHAALKVAPGGNRRISETEWTSLLALGKITMEISFDRESLVHNLQEDVLVITSDYLLKIEHRSGEFNENHYRVKDADLIIDHYRNRYQSNGRDESKEDSPAMAAFRTYEQELNVAFKEEFGFTYKDLMFVLYAIKACSFQSGSYHPVVQCKVEELVKVVQGMDTETMSNDYVAAIIQFLSLEEGGYSKGHMLFHSQMLREKQRLLVCPIVLLKTGLLIYGSQCVINSLNVWNNVVKGHFLFELPEVSPILTVLKQMHKKADVVLEGLVADTLKTCLPAKDVEKNIGNFKRLSPSFATREECGEIDALCINRANQTVFVFDAKNVIKRPSNYFIRNNIDTFFLSKKAYYRKLLKKKDFIIKNLPIILRYFGVSDPEGWIVKEAFVTSDLQFAAFYNHQKADFILVNEIEAYLNQNHRVSDHNE